MASHTRQREREETRSLSVRTLVIAFVAASAAGVVTSQFWIAGTWVSAGLTPVIVALVSELLHRPTEAVSRRLTSERGAVLPAPGGPAPPPPGQADVLPERAAAEPGSSEPGAPVPPVQVYGRRPRSRRRRVALGVVAITAVLAFAAAALAITSTELVTGGSIGKGNRKTTLFGGHKRPQREQPATTTQPEPQQSNPDTNTSTAPQKTSTEKKQPQQRTTTTPTTQTTPTTTSP
jgi:hypothetical protein